MSSSIIQEIQTLEEMFSVTEIYVVDLLFIGFSMNHDLAL